MLQPSQTVSRPLLSFRPARAPPPASSRSWVSLVRAFFVGHSSSSFQCALLVGHSPASSYPQCQRLRVFFNRCVRSMCRVTMRQVQRYRITTASLLKRLKISSFDEYYNCRLLRWAGHVARMPMTRTPRRLLTGWVDNPRPLGAPQMTVGRTIKKALKKKGLPEDFQGRSGWLARAQNRLRWHKDTQTQGHI